jgi:hypothetical protein
MRNRQTYLTPDEVIAALITVLPRVPGNRRVSWTGRRETAPAYPETLACIVPGRAQRHPGARQAGARPPSYFQHYRVPWDVGSAGARGRRGGYDGDVLRPTYEK